MEQEEIYIVSQKYVDGGWNKFVKSQEHYWYSAKEAQSWLDSQPDYLRVSNAVFKVRILIDCVEKVYDLKEANKAEWDVLRDKLCQSKN